MEKSGKTKFLIDGFPRKLDQAHKFDETVRHYDYTREYAIIGDES